MLLRCAATFPAIRQEAEARIEAFLASDEGRNKERTPDLGRLLICLALTQVRTLKQYNDFLNITFINFFFL